MKTQIAQNPNTSVDVLEKLSEDISIAVRTAVAQNPNTPLRVLEKLSDDESSSVRLGVVENPSTPLDLLETIRENEYESDDVIEGVDDRLAKDGFPYVSGQAKQRLSTKAV